MTIEVEVKQTGLQPRNRFNTLFQINQRDYTNDGRRVLRTCQRALLSLGRRKQGAIGAVIREIQESPEDNLDSTLGYAQYGVKVRINPDVYIICFDWNREEETLFVLTLGPASEMNS